MLSRHTHKAYAINDRQNRGFLTHGKTAALQTCRSKPDGYRRLSGSDLSSVVLHALLVGLAASKHVIQIIVTFRRQ